MRPKSRHQIWTSLDLHAVILHHAEKWSSTYGLRGFSAIYNTAHIK